jgi:hypothetical protein
MSAPVPEEWPYHPLEYYQTRDHEYYRGGLYSRLLSYQDGMIELEVRLTESPDALWVPHYLYILPPSWLRVHQLANAKRYRMWIYRTHDCDILLKVVTGFYPKQKSFP